MAEVSLAVSLLTDPAEVGNLDDSTIQWLLKQGISTAAIAGPWAVRASRVVFDTTEARYSPNPLGDFALIIPVAVPPSMSICDLAADDLVAWSPRSGCIGTRFGGAAALGEERIGMEGLGTTGLPIPVHRTPLGWLRADRHGLVIADAELAAHRLAGLILGAEDADHASELAEAIRLPVPEIVVRPIKRAA